MTNALSEDAVALDVHYNISATVMQFAQNQSSVRVPEKRCEVGKSLPSFFTLSAKLLVSLVPSFRPN